MANWKHQWRIITYSPSVISKYPESMRASQSGLLLVEQVQEVLRQHGEQQECLHGPVVDILVEDLTFSLAIFAENSLR